MCSKLQNVKCKLQNVQIFKFQMLLQFIEANGISKAKLLDPPLQALVRTDDSISDVFGRDVSRLRLIVEDIGYEESLV